MLKAAGRTALGRTGLTVSRLGVGGTPFGNLFRPIPDEDLAAAFDAAWTAGLRYFDTAPQYGGGLSEERLGRLLRAKPRDAFVLSSKVGKRLRPTADGRAPAGLFVHGHPKEVVYDYSYDGAMRSIEESLARLGLDRLDIVFVHDVARKFHGERVWEVYAEARDGAARALASLRDQGVIAAWGPASRELDVNLRFLAEMDADCLMLPSRYTLLDRSAGDELLPRCEEKGVGVLVAGAFDSGILATGARPGATYAYLPAEAAILERVRRFEAVCSRHGVPLAAIALQFPLRHRAVVSVVTGVASTAELRANVAHLEAEIPQAVWAELAA